MKKPRTMRELEALPKKDAFNYWKSLSTSERVKLANAMSTEEIDAMPKELTDSMRSLSAKTLDRALNELEAVRTEEGTFIFSRDDTSYEITKDYCAERLADLKEKFDGETEESLGFHAYHNMRLWIEAYETLLKEFDNQNQANNPALKRNEK